MFAIVRTSRLAEDRATIAALSELVAFHQQSASMIADQLAAVRAHRRVRDRETRAAKAKTTAALRQEVAQKASAPVQF